MKLSDYSDHTLLTSTAIVKSKDVGLIALYIHKQTMRPANDVASVRRQLWRNLTLKYKENAVFFSRFNFFMIFLRMNY